MAPATRPGLSIVIVHAWVAVLAIESTGFTVSVGGERAGLARDVKFDDVPSRVAWKPSPLAPSCR